jgi:hypothetical protein
LQFNQKLTSQKQPPKNKQPPKQIEEFSSQIKMVAASVQTGNIPSIDQIQKTYDLTCKLQEEIRQIMLIYINMKQYQSQRVQIPNNNNNNNNSNNNNNNNNNNNSGIPGEPGATNLPIPQGGEGIKIHPPTQYNPPMVNNNNVTSGKPMQIIPKSPNMMEHISFMSNNFQTQKKRQKRKREEFLRSCRVCFTTETPEWRRGPLGPRTYVIFLSQ